jgi:hypothetical protein
VATDRCGSTPAVGVNPSAAAESARTAAADPSPPVTGVTALSAVPALSSVTTDAAPAPRADAVDYAALSRELTLTRSLDGRLTMTMWVPDEFWRASFQNSGRQSRVFPSIWPSYIHIL